VRKALIAAGVAVAAVAGAIAAVVVSSGGGESAQSGSAGSVASTTGASSSSPLTSTSPTGGSGTTGTTTAPTATTSPVPITTVELPPPPGPHSTRRRSFTVGVVDDSLAQQSRSAAAMLVDISHRASFDAVVISATWQPGRTTPRRSTLRAVRNVAAAARRDHMRMFLVVWHGFARYTPRDAHERSDFAKYAASLVGDVPSLYAVIVGNEPNLNTFWKPQFGSGGRDVAAVGYEDLLARTYDAVKDVSRRIRVVGVSLSPRGADRPGGIRPTHSPTAFIRDLGAAYRASGRGAPLMDAFAIHPYMISPKVPPGVAHPKTTEITLADYPKLVTLLDEAFRGTPQRGRTLPILYTEFGVQTVVPPGKRSLYEAGTTYDAELGVSSATQAAYYRQALALAYCQPTVKGLFVFHTFDEPKLNGWQSGLYYSDRTPKPSLRGFRRAVAALRDGRLITCPS